MQRILLLAIICLALFGCKKENSNDGSPASTGLAGKWRMVSVKDNSTNAVTAKPLSISGDVDISFTYSSSNAGIMEGVTPTNSINGSFTTGNNSTLSIPVVGGTKIAETSWGQLFLTNIIYSTSFVVDNSGLLHISASTNKTISFTRR